MTGAGRRSRWLALAAGFVAVGAILVPAGGAGTALAGEQACDPFREPVVDPDVPTAQQVLGMPLGQRDVTAEESDRYLQAVSDASPRVVDGVLGRSVEGRPLRYAVVGRHRWVQPEALARIGREANRLRDPQTPAPVARDIATRNPAILWVAGNVHGDEESGTDASLRVLYELAARTDCTTDTILDKAVVVVLPMQNPDAREADTRRNRYGFDLNRDWFARTQPETEAKLEKLRELPPQLFVDAHEMGRETYFFPPNADPVYHEIGESALDWIYNLYGTAMQDAFGRFDIPYFNGSPYDLFYMGYGDTVPSTAFNAAGMTFEKHNGDPADRRVREQYVAIWSTLMAAGRRDSMLSEWRAEYVTAYRQGLAGELEPNRLYYEGTEIDNPVPDIRVRHYFLRTDQPAKADEVQRLARRLQRMDVDVYRLARPLRVPDYTPYGRAARETTLPAGTLWVPMAQGQKHWVQAMLHEDTYVPFPYFYDVTAWSGPLLENVAGGRSGARLEPRAVELAPQPEPEPPRVDAPRLAVWQISDTSSSSIESAGWLRWWLDHQARLDYTDLTAERIADGALSAYDVLVVPNGSDATAINALGERGRDALRTWVREGGTLVTLRDSSRLTARLRLTSATFAEPTSDVPGSLVRVELDPDSPLAAEVGRTAYAMYEYDFVWSTPSQQVAPVRFPEEGDPDWFVSGFARGEEQLHGRTAVVDEAAGEGRVVLFGFEPNYRAFTGGTAQILLNAITGPAPSGQVDLPDAATQASGTTAVSQRLVVSVRPDVAPQVRKLLSARGAAADVVRSRGVVSFRVDLQGRTGEQHPWARQLVEEVTALGRGVVAVRVP